MKYFILILWFCFSSIMAYPCTSFIISGKATPSGRPMMFKHRDTGCLDNRLAYFQGERYAFIGLVNAPSQDGEVWAGMNDAGFCIMNTASYNLRNDTLSCPMDREGELMYHALGQCATIHDFENFLESYPQPWGVEANFGIIDANGGAVYFEMNNSQYIKYDVNTMPIGYRVVTNFSEAGDSANYAGYERYLTASAIMQEHFSQQKELSAFDAINLFSRQYSHHLLGVDYNQENAPIWAVDQDFIPRRSTSAVICFQGVPAKTDPQYTVMWTALGYPACAVTIPVLMREKSIPDYLLARNSRAKTPNALQCDMCDASLKIKNNWIFPLTISNGKRYLSTEHIFRGANGQPSLLDCTRQIEEEIADAFLPLYQQWVEGALSTDVFYKWYNQLTPRWFTNYKNSFQYYLSNQYK